MGTRQLTAKIHPKKYERTPAHQKYLVGLALNHNVSLRIRYSKSLRKLVNRMTLETKNQVTKLFKSGLGQDYFEDQKQLAAMDASLASQSKILLNALLNKFSLLFNNYATPLSEEMVGGAEKSSVRSLNDSIKKLSGGLTLNSDFIPNSVKEVSKAAIAENVSLIKSIPEQYFTQINGAVMRSITTGSGLKELTEELNKYSDQSDRRVKNIAIDQTRKAYNSINKQRMMSAGYKKFIWLHSGGGQKPREEHVEMNGKMFSFDDPPIIDSKTGERGFPSQLINCGCTMKPVYEFPEEDEEEE